jgi:transposase
MFAIGPATKIFLASGATDMRKGFNGLYAMVQHGLEAEPLSGHLYVFCNRRGDCLKIFAYDGTGMWVCAKRLEKGTFRWPKHGERSVQMSATELQMLLSGIDLSSIRKRSHWWIKSSENKS